MTIDVTRDEHGVIRSGALAGLIPVDTGRRIGARVVDVVLGLCPYVIAMALATGNAFGVALAASVLLPLAFAVFGLFTLITAAATPGQFLLGLGHVNQHTGQKASGGAFLKYLVEGLVSMVTVGLSLIASWLTIKGPLNQNWVDRVGGVVLIDKRRSRPAGEPMPAAPAARPAGPVTVHMPEPRTSEPTLGSAPTPALPTSTAAGTTGSSADPASTGAAPLIERVPWALDRPATPVSSTAAPTVLPAPEAQSSPLGLTTVSAPVDVASAGGFELVLDNGVVVPVGAAVVIGRDPVAPRGVGAVELVPVADQGMSISKTHLAIGRAPDGLWVRDLRSTNGVLVRSHDGTERTIAPGAAQPVRAGETVLFGDRSLEVRDV